MNRVVPGQVPGGVDRVRIRVVVIALRTVTESLERRPLSRFYHRGHSPRCPSVQVHRSPVHRYPFSYSLGTGYTGVVGLDPGVKPETPHFHGGRFTRTSVVVSTGGRGTHRDLHGVNVVRTHQEDTYPTSTSTPFDFCPSPCRVPSDLYKCSTTTLICRVSEHAIDLR